MDYEQDILNRMRQPQKRGLGDSIARFGSILATGQPPKDEDGATRLANQMALMQYREGMKNPEDAELTRELKRSQISANEAMAAAEPGEGQIKVGNKIVNDPSYKRQPTQEERNAELNDEVAKNELSQMSKALPKLDQADQAAKQLQDLYGQAVKPEPKSDDVLGSIGQRLSGVPKTASAFLGMNPELNRYKANRKAFSGNIAKGGFGESGMLTQQDIERISSILPTEYSNKEESDIAWNEIKTILGSARIRFEEKKNSYLNPQQGQSAMASMRTPNTGIEPQSTSFNSPEEADASGLPPGTKVTVNGRPYEIG